MKRTLFFSLISFGLSIFALGCGNTSIGVGCTDNEQCDNGQTCYTAAPGGYCTNGCFVEGSDEDCPAGSVCSNTSLGLVCARLCTDQGDCREEYECNGVSRSDAKVCAPKA